MNKSAEKKAVAVCRQAKQALGIRRTDTAGHADFRYGSASGCIKYGPNSLTTLKVDEIVPFVRAICAFFKQNGKPFDRSEIPELLHWCMSISFSIWRTNSLGEALSASQEDWLEAFDIFTTRCAEYAEETHTFSIETGVSEIAVLTKLYQNTGRGEFREYPNLLGIIKAHESAVRQQSKAYSEKKRIKFVLQYYTAEQLCALLEINYQEYLHYQATRP